MMKAYYSDPFTFPLPANHRFPLEKYALLRKRVEESGLIPTENLMVPDPTSDEQLLLVHTVDYLERVKCGTLTEKEIRRIGLPWSSQLVERSRRSVGGTISACRTALLDGISVNLSGGTHHAFHDHGAGYCIFNDVAVAARSMQAENRVQRTVILDCDVHQGDGTAAIFADDPSVFTFSIHGDRNYPFYKVSSDLDIALPDGTGDEGYCEALAVGIRQSIEQAKAGLAVYLAGADPYKEDFFGRLALSKEGLANRDRIVLEACKQWNLSLAIVMSGGYARNIDDIVDIHFNTIRLAHKMYNESCS